MSKRTFKDWMLESDLKVLESIPEDFEFSMARGELKTIKRSAERIMKHLDGEGDLEAWVQSKITKANDYLNSVANHMDGGEDDTEKNSDVKEEKHSKEMKSCPDGKYWCMNDKKCKKIPKGWHVMRSGYLMKDEEKEEENKNGNGNGEGSESNGGGVSEGCGSTHETKKKKKKLSEMISTSSVTGRRFRDISSKEDQEQLEKEKSKKESKDPMN